MEIDYELNYYKILNVDYEFTADAIRNEYRTLSKKYHPDVSKEENADIIFKQIIIAYKVLTSEEKRKDYDIKSRHGQNYTEKNELYNFEFSNISKQREKYSQNIDKYKKDELMHIVIEMKEFQSHIEYERYIVCNHCNGKGKDMDSADYECAMCDGTGTSMLDNKRCTSCGGHGSIGIKDCKHCAGKKRTLKKESIVITRDMFNEEGKLKLDYKGNQSQHDIGKTGHLYLVITSA
jgi:molecular chaperone DnaJ